MEAMRSVELRAKSGTTLDDIEDYIRREKPDLRTRASRFEIAQGAAPLFGAGDGPAVRVTIEWDRRDNKTLQDVHDIIERAGLRPNEISLELDGETVFLTDGITALFSDED